MKHDWQKLRANLLNSYVLEKPIELKPLDYPDLHSRRQPVLITNALLTNVYVKINDSIIISNKNKHTLYSPVVSNAVKII